MRFYGAAVLVGILALFQSGLASTQAKAPKVFLLEDPGTTQWCAYNAEATWNARVLDVGAMRVGTLTYSNDHLSTIDATETDESGDWTVYDHYFLNDRSQIVKLSRMINVLPGDKSIVQTFMISDGKAAKVGTTAKQLSTGKPLTLPKSVWLPELTVRTEIRTFPFSALLRDAGLRISATSCVKASAPK
jgi:hypothetical protein